MDAAQKFWILPELGERLISFLDPLSSLQLAQSDVMDKAKAWSDLIGRSLLQEELSRFNFEQRKEDVKVFVKILQVVELNALLMPLLDLICDSSIARHGYSVEMVCPCRPDPHIVSSEGFRILEEVEGALQTTEQSLKSIGSVGTGWHYGNMLSAIGSRMSRQENEIVTSIYLVRVEIEDKKSLEAFITLMQAQEVSVHTLWLDARKAEFGEEEWLALAGALRGKPELFDLIWISRQDLTGVRESIRDIWDVTKYAFEVFSKECTWHRVQSRVDKSDDWDDWEQAWRRLKQIADMTDDEFAAECQREIEGEDGAEEESEEDSEGDGEEEESDDDDGDEDEN